MSARERFEVCHKRRRPWILLFRLCDGHSSDEVWLNTLCHNANHKKKPVAHPLATAGLFMPSHVPNESGNVIFPAPADPMRLVQEELAVAERRFGVLINGHDDGLDVMVAPTTCSDHPAHHQTFSTPGEPKVPKPSSYPWKRKRSPTVEVKPVRRMSVGMPAIA
jgi:hypothetical protein